MMFQGGYRPKLMVYALTILLVYVQGQNDTVTTTELSCTDGEFILNNACATCHCRDRCNTVCDPKVGCSGGVCGEQCDFGYTGFPACQLVLPTPTADAIEWKSKDPHKVTFTVKKEITVEGVPSPFYMIDCESKIPLDRKRKALEVKQFDEVTFDGMTSLSYDCSAALRSNRDESQPGYLFPVTPCTGWKVPTANNISVDTSFQVKGEHKLVMNVVFPASTNDCHDFPPTYELTVKTTSGEKLFEVFGEWISNFTNIIDKSTKGLTPGTSYKLELKVVDYDQVVSTIRKTFTTPRITTPTISIDDSVHSEPMPGQVDIKFPTWESLVSRTGNVAPDRYLVVYKLLNGTEVVTDPRSVTGNVTEGMVSTSILINYPGLTFEYSIYVDVSVYGKSYTSYSDSSRFITRPCEAPSPFGIGRTEFGSGKSVAVNLYVYFSESMPHCAGSTTYKLQTSRGTDIRTASCLSNVCPSGNSLVPCSKYNITVIATNQAGLSISSDTRELTTPVRAPAKPTNLRLSIRDSSTVEATWDPPTGSNCPVTNYKVSVYYQEGSSYIYMEKDIGLNQTFTFVGNYYRNYDVTIRSVNNDGAGAIAKGSILVPAIKPGPPLNLSVVTWNTNCVNVSWAVPAEDGGVIEAYDAICTVDQAFGNISLGGHKMTYKMPVAVDRSLHTLVCNLLAGSRYRCTAAARNGAGSSAAYAKLVWTFPKKPVKPAEPMLYPERFTAKTATIFLPLADKTDRPATAYYVGLEPYSSDTEGTIRNLESLQSSDFGEYGTDLPGGKYITAKLKEEDVGTEFVIGNGKSYGGYHNGPLEKGEQYIIYYGVEVKRGEITKQTFYRSTEPFTVEKGRGVVNPQVTIAVVSSVITMLIVFIIAIIIFVIIRKRRGGGFSRRPTLRAELIPLKRRLAVNHKAGEADNGEDSSMNLAPISVNHLKSYIISNQEDISRQCRALPTGFLAPYTEAIEGANKEKNRFANILPYDKSRVILSQQPDIPLSDYINASYIEGYNKNMQYIAASGPKPNTCADFWRMVYELKTTCIVMVTKCVEEGKLKCEKYWPDERETEEYGDLEITCSSTETWADFTMNTFNVRKKGDAKPLTCHHFLFLSWPDHGVPRNSTPFLLFRRKVKSFSSGISSPLVVHCSAGVGRTGTFIAIDYLLDQAETEKKINVFHLVQSMRNQRVSMVQTIDQYHYIYQAVCEAWETKDFYYSAPLFQDSYLSWNSEDIIERQFEALREISAQVESFDFEVGGEKENKTKNQNPAILPHDQHRAYIMSVPRGYSSYINAVFINSYRKKGMFIATQMPLPHTVDDYLRLLFDQEVQTVVSLESRHGTSQKFGTYLPDDISTPLETDLFTVTMTQVNDKKADIVIADISLTYKHARGEATAHFQHIQANFWQPDDPLPQDSEMLVTLLEQVEKNHKITSEGSPICVQCRDGNERTSLFLTLWNALDRLKTEQEIDVYHTVELIRMIRPQAITSTHQYKYVYERLYTYLQEFDLYANYK